jgi:hypothetical protein
MIRRLPLIVAAGSNIPVFGLWRVRRGRLLGSTDVCPARGFSIEHYLNGLREAGLPEA